jgi:hypothetical protein
MTQTICPYLGYYNLLNEQAKEGVDSGPAAVIESGILDKLKQDLGLSISFDNKVHNYSDVIPQDDPPFHNMNRPRTVSAATKKLSSQVYEHVSQGRRVLTLGGDDSIGIGTVSGVAKAIRDRFDRDLAVIWVDAHGDINTPESSRRGHKLLVVHGDIKPENILVFEGGVGRLTAKVSDFGFSQSDSHPRWTGQEAGGTEYWNAPECLHTATESLRTFSKLNHRDIYSFGLLTCFVLLEELPFDEQGWGAKELSAEKLGGQIGKAMISRWRSTKSGQAKQTYGILDFNGIETDELNVSCSMPLKLSCE